MGITTSLEEHHSPLTRKRRVEKMEAMMEGERTLRFVIKNGDSKPK